MSPAQANQAHLPIKREYFPALDGLRGIAILLVLLCHNFSFVNDIFFLGQLGVDLFFVLSGFLITDILLATVGKKNYLKNFYARRVLRIFPVYYLSLVVILLILPLISSHLSLEYYTQNQVFLWTYLQNWLYVFNDPESMTLLPLWSLAVEEQFYLLWPLTILLLKKPQRALLFIIVLLVLYILIKFFIWHSPVAFEKKHGFFTYTRIDGICIGCMVALFRKINPGIIARHSWWILVSVILVNTLLLLVSGYNMLLDPYLGLVGYTSFSILFGLLINKVVSNDSPSPRSFLDYKPLRFIGKISYGIYIYHLPIYLTSLYYFLPKLNGMMGEPVANALVSVFSLIVAILTAWLSYNLFEKYFLSIKKKFT